MRLGSKHIKIKISGLHIFINPIEFNKWKTDDFTNYRNE
jgi:hypothetical protein